MSYFDNLLKELQVEYNVPLWKIVNRIDEEKQKELVKYITIANQAGHNRPRGSSIKKR